MKTIHFIFIFGCYIMMSSCISQRAVATYMQQKQTAANIQLSEIKVTPQIPNKHKIIPPKVIDILHSDIEVKFNWDLHQCIGKEKIILKPFMYETDSIVLDAKSMIFHEIKIENSQRKEILYLPSYNKKQLTLKLENKISSNDTILLTLRYTALPDSLVDENGKAIRNNKGLYFVNTKKDEPFKPTQLWTQGEPESNSCWFPTIDKTNEKFTSSITIELPKNFTSLSNGKLVSTKFDGDTKIDKWVNDKPMPAYLHMMAVGDFNVTKDNWNGKLDTTIRYRIENKVSSESAVDTSIQQDTPSDSLHIIAKDSVPMIETNGMEVSYYLEPSYAQNARSIFKNTVEMIDFYSNKLGVIYPWNKYAQVVVRDYVSGAMENTSATLHGDFVQKNNRELVDNSNDDIIAHELFHQWFGDLVTCKTWSHLVLNEGFASFGELLWYEYKYGKDAAQKKGYESLNRYINYAKNYSDGPLINYDYKNPDDMFNVITYQKGARVLQLLRSELGENAFFAGLKSYLTNYAYSSADIDDFRKEMEKTSGRDLQLFFEQWFLNGGHPIIDIRYDYKDSSHQLMIQIEQKQNGDLFKFPLSFKVSQGEVSKTYTFQINKKIESFNVSQIDENANSYPNVFVDPDGNFLGEIIDNKPFYNHILTYNHATSYLEKVRSLQNIVPLQNSVDTIRFTLLSAINDRIDDIRLKALEWINWNEHDNFNQVKDFLIYIANNDFNAKVRASAVRIIGEKKDSSFIDFLIKHTKDSSYTVAGISLKYLYQLAPFIALSECKYLEKDAKGELFNQITNIYSESGNENNLAYFFSEKYKIFNAQRASFITNFSKLLIKYFTPNQSQEAIRYFLERAENDTYSQVRINAFRALKQINIHKEFLLNQEGVDTSPILYFRNEIDNLNTKIQEIIQNEKSKEVLNALIIEGMYKEPVDSN